MALPLNLSTDALRDLLGGRFRSSTPLRNWNFLCSPRFAGSEDVAILGARIPLAEKRETKTGLRIVGLDNSDDSALEVPSPEAALALLVRHLARIPPTDDWLSQEETVARFGEIARFARIHRSARIGSGCRMGAGVVVHAGVSIGEDCVLGDQVVLGSEGFGLFPDGTGRLDLLPHRAGVVLDPDVQIGAFTNVAAGLIEPTWIGTGSRLDAHIQVGHNVRIGPRCVLAGQSGLAGSAELGEGCVVGGKAAISDHVRLGDRCVVAAKAGVTKSWGDGVVLRGFPARPA